MLLLFDVLIYTGRTYKCFERQGADVKEQTSRSRALLERLTGAQISEKNPKFTTLEDLVLCS
jgi:hypothetical protein